MGVARYSVVYNRSFSSRRASPTIGVSVMIPGSSTWLPISHITARLKSVRGPSSDDRTRAARNSRSSSSPAAKSR